MKRIVLGRAHACLALGLSLILIAIGSPGRFGPAGVAQAGQEETPAPATLSLDLIPTGIKGEVAGTVSIRLPPGYELAETLPNASAWGEGTVRWTDYDYRGTQVLDTMTAPDGSQQSSLGSQIDGIGFGGGVLYTRGNADIQAEAAHRVRPYVQGTIYEEGAFTVPGDGGGYAGYYYLSTSTEEHTTVIDSRTGEEIEHQWTSVHHHLYARVALSQSQPLYTVAVWGWTWGVPDHTDGNGWMHVYTIDGLPQFDRHREYLKELLSTIQISGFQAPSAAPEGKAEITGSKWLDAIPLPTEVSTDPEVIGTNLGLALFFALALGLTSALFNSTLEENEELIDARLAPLLVPLRRAAARLPRLAGQGIRIAQAVLLLLLAALLYAFLDPGFGISAGGATIYFSLLVALVVSIYSYKGIQVLLGGRFYQLRARFRLFPIALAFGLLCVLLTRWMDFHPGYLYGFVAGFAFLGMEAETPRRWALLVLAGACALLVASLVAWGLAAPVHKLAADGSAGASVLYGALVAVFVAGLEGLLFALAPLTFMDGSRVMAWSRVAWGAAFGLAAWLFFHVLINPGSAYLDALAGKKVLVMLGTLAAYGLLAVGAWLFFRWYARRGAAANRAG
jgi:hypothetical protein